jgi:hypothetical protein
MRLSQSHDKSCGFGKLIRVKSSLFFNFISTRLSQSHDLGHEFDGLT